MPEPTMRDLERMLLRLGRTQAETRALVLTVKADVAAVAAEQGGARLIAAAVDELTATVDHLSEQVAASNQIITGVRSLGVSSFDIATALSRRFRKLVQRLTERGIIAVEALREDELETEGNHAAAAPGLHAVDASPE